MTLITTLLLSFLVILSAIAAMAIGVIFSGRKISGSCGGIGGSACELCSNDCQSTESSDTQAKEKLV